MVRRGKKRTRERGETTWGEGGVCTLRHFPCLTICVIPAFRFLDRTLEQKDICARLTFKEYPNFYRENVPRPRNVGGGISQRYERERVRETQYTNMETKGKEKEKGNLSLQRISRGHRFRRRRLPHPLLKSTHKTPDWE